jgi:hypothetical protein
MTYLTEQQRDTLNAAEQILIDFLADGGGNLMFSLHTGWTELSTTYFSPSGGQHGSFVRWEPGLAGKIDQAAAIRAVEVANADKLKAIRIARLKAELESLGALA